MRGSAAAAPGVSTLETPAASQVPARSTGESTPSLLHRSPALRPSPAPPFSLPEGRSFDLPLARSVPPIAAAPPGALQREMASDGVGGSPEIPAISAADGAAAESVGSASAAAVETSPDPTQAAEDLADRVLQRVLRTLAVEGERRGLRTWL